MAKHASNHASNQSASFERDLGYLDKFLGALKAHAEGLAQPQRDELVRLLSEETERWARIKQLLGGAAAQAPSARPTPAQTIAPVVESTTESAPRGWTVGSLMPKR